MSKPSSNSKSFKIKTTEIDCFELTLSSGKSIRVLVENDKNIRVIADHTLQTKNWPKNDKDWKIEKLCPHRIGLEHFHMD